MRVIVSTELDKSSFSNFVVVQSFTQIRELENVSMIVLHEFKESDFEVGVFLSEFYQNGVKKFIYINKKPSEAIKAAIIGVRGKTFEDTFYFDDEDELDALAEECFDEECTEISNTLESTRIVKDFIKRFLEDDNTIKAPLYLNQVQSALNDLSNTNQRQTEQIISMGSTAIDTFEKANAVISSIAKQKKVLEDQLRVLTEDKPRNSFHTQPLNGNILFFPTVQYTGTPKMLFIREVAPCRYLTSYILAYEHYLHYEKNKRVKLIFVHQKGNGVAKRYEQFTSITQESMHVTSLYDSNIIATNNPKQDVMKKLFSRPADVFIVVDRLYGQRDIVSGRVNKLNAVSGRADMQRYNLKPDNCIFTFGGTENTPDDTFYTIPIIGKYPQLADVQKVAYMQICKESFEKINKFLGI